MIFDFVALAIVNPLNLMPTVAWEEDGKKKMYFAEDVYSSVPRMLRILSACYFALTLIATVLVKFPKDLHLEYSPVTTTSKNNGSTPEHHHNIDP